MEETYFNLEIDRNEVYRYLGAGQTAPSSVLGELAEECIGMIRNTARPARYFRIFPCAGNGETEVRIGPLTVMSRALVRNLDGCREVCLFGATLGAGVDRLIARAQAKGEMTRALALQAAGAAMLEAFCDKTEEEIRRAAAAQSGRSAEEVFLRPRFSPGYGDFGLEYQRDLFRILELQKRTGMVLTESLMMLPSKSVTAVTGLADAPCSRGNTCSRCAKTECAYRKP